MQDILLIGVLIVSFGIIGIFIHWCDTQIKAKKIEKE